MTRSGQITSIWETLKPAAREERQRKGGECVLGVAEGSNATGQLQLWKLQIGHDNRGIGFRHRQGCPNGLGFVSCLETSLLWILCSD